MNRIFKIAGIGLLVWITILVPVCFVSNLIVNMTNQEAVDYKNGKITSISTPKLEIYEERRNEFLKLSIITSLIISQVAVAGCLLSKEDLSKW